MTFFAKKVITYYQSVESNKKKLKTFTIQLN